MDDLLINNDDAYKPMRDNAKQIIKKPSNVEDFELFEFTEKVQTRNQLSLGKETNY